MTHERIRLGISACLLGEPVRFDGGHKRDPFLVESLGQFVDWVPVCPEVESGLDAPRESMRLVQADGRIRLLTNRTAQDHTTRMHGYARRRVEELVDDALVGFVLKKDSPTCGLERVSCARTSSNASSRIAAHGPLCHALVDGDCRTVPYGSKLIFHESGGCVRRRRFKDYRTNTPRVLDQMGQADLQPLARASRD